MGVKNSEGLTIRQAAQALKVSAKTVRRRLLAGELPFKLVEGKFGPEYRITELPGHDGTFEGRPSEVNPTLGQALDMVSKLQAENRDLAGALGASQEKVRNLEAQVLLLTESKKPWWRRLLGR